MTDTATPWPTYVPLPAMAPPGDPLPSSLAPSWEDAPLAPHRPCRALIPQRAEVLSERDALATRPETLEAMLARLRANPPPATRFLRTYAEPRLRPPPDVRTPAPAGAWMDEVVRRGR